MENLKRTFSETASCENQGPPTKIAQLTKDANIDKTLDVELFQKEAIWRQLQEARRSSKLLERQLETWAEEKGNLQSKAVYYEAWWRELLNQLCIFTSTFEKNDLCDDSLGNAFFFKSDNEFKHFLDQYQTEITLRLKEIAQILEGNTKSENFQELISTKCSDLSAQLSVAKSKIAILAKEKEDILIQFNNAQQDYMEYARKMDRSNSKTLNFINGIANGNIPIQSPDVISIETRPADEKTDSPPMDAEFQEKLAKLEEDQASLTALCEQLKKELEKANEAEANFNVELSKQKFRLNDLSAEDMEDNLLYKELKIENEELQAKHDDIIPKVNKLEKELQNLRSERSSFKEQLEDEYQKALTEVQSQLLNTEKDLARIRGARDDLHAQLQTRISQENQSKDMYEEITRLSEANSSRVKALEAEIERLKIVTDASPDIDWKETAPDLSIDEYKERLVKLQKQNEILSMEIPAMETAFKKAQKQTTNNIEEATKQAAKISKLQAEKIKADQRYFASMKAKDTLSNENRQLKIQINGSKDAIIRVQESEALSLERANVLESQTLSLQNANEKLTSELLAIKASLSKEKASVKHFESRYYQMCEILHSESSKLKQEKMSRQAIEQDYIQQKARYDELNKQHKRLKTLKGSEDSTELVAYRQMAKCGVCNNNWRNRAITICGHTFCDICIEKRLQSRLRRCPICNMGFGVNDLIIIHF